MYEDTDQLLYAFAAKALTDWVVEIQATLVSTRILTHLMLYARFHYRDHNCSFWDSWIHYPHVLKFSAFWCVFTVMENFVQLCGEGFPKCALKYATGNSLACLEKHAQIWNYEKHKELHVILLLNIMSHRNNTHDFTYTPTPSLHPHPFYTHFPGSPRSVIGP